MRRLLRPSLLLGLAIFVSGVAHAAEWGTIVPGASTPASVRARWGEPSRRAPIKVEGYDTIEWVYEGDRAPSGLRRLVIEFGLLTPAGYKPDLVRLFRIEPVPGVFTRQTVLLGWGRPTRISGENPVRMFFYQEGLVVEFDTQGWNATRMTFMPPQPQAD